MMVIYFAFLTFKIDDEILMRILSVTKPVPSKIASKDGTRSSRTFFYGVFEP